MFGPGDSGSPPLDPAELAFSIFSSLRSLKLVIEYFFPFSFSSLSSLPFLAEFCLLERPEFVA
jgi:hypothetical protein